MCVCVCVLNLLQGTNDKAGSHLNLLRWTQAQTIKETMVPLRDIAYPHMK